MKRRGDRRDEESSRLENHSVARDIVLVVAGLGIGSSVALLLAPDSGEEIRHAIGRRYHKALRQLGRRTENLRERAEDLLDRAAHLRSSKLLGSREAERSRAA